MRLSSAVRTVAVRRKSAAWMLNRFSIDCTVVRLSPSRLAAPSAPERTPFVSRRMRKMCSRSISVRLSSIEFSASSNSVGGAARTAPLVMMTMRSSTFSSSRMLPGQFWILQNIDRVIGNHIDALIHLLAVLLDEMLDQHRDISPPFTQRWQFERKDIQPVEKIFAELLIGQPPDEDRDSSPRRCARPRAGYASPPSRSNSRSCKTRSSLGCSSSGNSPISSRNSVPLSASSMRPTFWLTALVNAPFSWPNSSLSSSPEGTAAQLSFTKLLSLRGTEPRAQTGPAVLFPCQFRPASAPSNCVGRNDAGVFRNTSRNSGAFAR